MCEPQDKESVDPTRVGGPTNHLLTDGGLSLVIGDATKGTGNAALTQVSNLLALPTQRHCCTSGLRLMSLGCSDAGERLTLVSTVCVRRQYGVRKSAAATRTGGCSPRSATSAACAPPWAW